MNSIFGGVEKQLHKHNKYDHGAFQFDSHVITLKRHQLTQLCINASLG